MVVRHGGRADEDGGAVALGNETTRLNKFNFHPEGTEGPWKNFQHGSHRKLIAYS